MASIGINNGTRAVVMGLGRFGGGLGVARWLLDRGATVTINDKADAETLAEPLSKLNEHPRVSNLRLELGHHDESVLDDADVLIVNPAVPRPWDNPLIQAAERRGLRLDTEIGLLLRHLPREARVIGVTGTVGKSTTAAMIHHALRGAGITAWLGGNIGGSLLADLDSISAKDVVVLELSSAMLHWLRDEPALRPSVGVLTNLESNHIDWHGSADHYAKSKQILLDGLPFGADAVLGFGVARCPVPPGVTAHVIHPTDRIDDLAIPGDHNAWNAAVAVHVAVILGADIAHAVDAVRAFPGLPHRLCLIRESNGVRWYDDSKSSTPAAAVTAINAVAPITDGTVHLILGGYDKQAGFAPLDSNLPENVRIYAMGATMPEIVRTFDAVFEAQTLERAMAEIMQSVKPGDAVLLSPACASWDQFTSFEQRGKRFAALAAGQTGELA